VLLHYLVKQETCKLSFHLNAEMTKSVTEQWSLHRGVSVALLHSVYQEASKHVRLFPGNQNARGDNDGRRAIIEEFSRRSLHGEQGG